MKLVISKNKNGKGYYSKIQNDFNGKHTEKYLSLQLPKDNEYEYGLYDVDGFLSTYEKKDGTVEFKLVVTDINLNKKYEKKETNPFADFGNEHQEEFELKDDAGFDLPF